MPSYKSKTGYACSCPDGNCDMSCRMYRLISNKPSNADRIRAMTDEELAEFLSENDSNFPIGDHKKEWLNWLKQEV